MCEVWRFCESLLSASRTMGKGLLTRSLPVATLKPEEEGTTPETKAWRSKRSVSAMSDLRSERTDQMGVLHEAINSAQVEGPIPQLDCVGSPRYCTDS